MPDKRDIHQAKSKGRHKSGGQPGSRRGGAIAAGPDPTDAVAGTDQSTNEAGVSGRGHDKRSNSR